MGIVGFVLQTARLAPGQHKFMTDQQMVWVPLLGIFLFSLIGALEMSQTLTWDDLSIRMHPRWGFEYLGSETSSVLIADITEISAGFMSNEALDGKPFTTIEFTDGVTSVPIRTDNFFRYGMQELLANVARLRPDLELPDNLRAYLRGEYDDIWPR